MSGSTQKQPIARNLVATEVTDYSDYDDYLDRVEYYEFYPYDEMHVENDDFLTDLESAWTEGFQNNDRR